MNGWEERDRGIWKKRYREETAGARALRLDKFGVFMGQKEGQCGEW